MINAKYGKPKKLKGIEQSLFLTFRYKQNIVDAIRKITPRYWHNEEKMWEIEYSALSELKFLLPKEEIDVYGEPINQKQYMEKLVDHTVTLPKAIKTELFPYQKETFDEGMSYERYIYNLDPGLGKAQPLYSKLLTPNGYITMGEVKVGDEIFGEDGLPHKVLGVFPQGKQKVYELTFDDGCTCRCSEDHLWKVKRRNKDKTLTTSDIIKSSLYRSYYHPNHNRYFKEWLFSIPIVKPLHFPSTPVIIDPWLLGVILGDGNITNNLIVVTNSEEDIMRKVHDIVISDNMQINMYRRDRCSITRKSGDRHNKYLDYLRKVGLLHKDCFEKFVPNEYKYNSYSVRLAILQGLFATDGHVSKSNFIYGTVSEHLADDIVYLVQSLGGICHKYCDDYVCCDDTEIHRLYRLRIKMPMDDMLLCTDKHKCKYNNRARHTSVYRKIRDIEYIGEEECQCILVDNPTHLYLTDNLIVTHNTNCTLATVLKRIELGQVKRVLVLACLNLLKYTWQQEVVKHTVGVNCRILGNRQNSKGIWLTKGTKEKLEDLQNIEDDVQIYITNIESIREKTITDKLVKLMDKGEFDCIVVDESHKVVSVSAQQSKALMRLTNHVKYVYLLTGTILMNRPDDLYIPLKITGAFDGNYANFKSRYNIYGGYMDRQIVGHKHLDELQAKLMSVSKRLKKQDVLKDLPEKIYVDELLDMKSKQTKIYKDVLNSILADIDIVRLSISPLSQLIRLRQATADTSLLSSTVHESIKFERALEIIGEIIDKGESVIVFSCWEQVISNFRKFLSENHLISSIITGKIRDRESQIKNFNENDDCHIIVGTVGAMGVGLTLNKASNVIFLDESWSASEKLQAMDRCHRLGQKNSVTVYTLICKNTIDEHINHIVKRKGILGDALVDAKYDLKNEKVLNYLLTGEGELD